MASQYEELAEALADRYRLERPLGSGGMADVYLAQDLKHHRPVAVKVVRPELAVIGNDRFRREIEVAAALTHPHILPVHDSGEAAGVLYYVMPYLEGESLRVRLRRERQLPLEEALRLTGEVADALSFAHQRGVVHRDIKPENILLQAGHATVADFGIARVVNAAAEVKREARGSAITQPGEVIGTPGYMSPEQALGEADLDGRSDQYSLACMLYEMLAGSPPFAEGNIDSILMRHLTVEAPRITDIAPGVPNPVAAALARALAKAPADRFSGMSEFMDALRAPEAPVGAPPPAQLTSFIGRERETAAVEGLLQSARLVTLTGVGGSGKTRLALEVAGRVAGRFRNGVAWVELAPLSNAELVSQHVADAMGVRRDGIRGAGEACLEALRDWDGLLVLDNCEHLVEAVARLCEGLLRVCPKIFVLATSREALGIDGERAWSVPPLTLPPPGQPVTRAAAVQSEAIRLFVERAQAVRPTFELLDGNAEAIARIVQRLDGLPLAIELAAARTRVLDAQQIAARLDDVFALLSTTSRATPPRHRTLRSTIEWSHDLLTQPERVMFRRLAVFAGGFTIDAVEAVTPGDGILAADVLDLLSGLVDKSLITLETEAIEARYRMLETMRQFARERLEEAGEAAAIGGRHARFFLSRAETAEPHITNQTEGWQERLTEDAGNLRAAADWFERDAAAVDEGLRLVGALHWFWFALGQYREARQRVEAALARSGPVRTRSRGRALSSLATFLALQGETAAAGPLAAESVDILRETAGPSVDLVVAMVGLGQSRLTGGAIMEATEVLAEALAVSRGVQPRYWITYALYWSGCAALARGDIAAARTAFDEGVAVALADGFTQPIGHLCTIRGRLALLEGDKAAAVGWFEVALPALRKMKNHFSTIILAEDLARIVSERGDAASAARLLGAVARLREEAGAAPLPVEREAIERFSNAVRDTLGPAAFVAAFQAGRTLTLLQTLDLAATMVTEPAREAALPRASPAPLLQVKALGPLEIAVNGESLPTTSWRSATSRELLLYLLCSGAGRTREQIGRSLWSDAPLAQMKNTFHVTLHQLRRTLGKPDWVVFEEARYRINPRFRAEFDGAQFEAEVRAGRSSLAKTGDRGQLERALARYRGDFLEGAEAGAWHREPRERWRRLYEEGRRALG